MKVIKQNTWRIITMANEQKKKPSIAKTLLKIVGVIIGGVLIGEGAHQTNEANQRNKAMKASMQENNKDR